MKLDGVHAAILPVQSRPIVQSQALPEATESEPEVTTEEAGGKASGVISKLNEGGHFNAVADIRLRIAHYDNPDLVTIEPETLENADVPGKAYEKFLEQYEALYQASQTPEPETPAPDLEPTAITEPLTEPDGPVIGNPVPEPVAVIIDEPVAEVPPVSEEPPAVQEPVDEGVGILPAFEELWDIQALEENSETLDIVM